MSASASGVTRLVAIETVRARSSSIAAITFEKGRKRFGKRKNDSTVLSVQNAFMCPSQIIWGKPLRLLLLSICTIVHTKAENIDIVIWLNLDLKGVNWEILLHALYLLHKKSAANFQYLSDLSWKNITDSSKWSWRFCLPDRRHFFHPRALDQLCKQSDKNRRSVSLSLAIHCAMQVVEWYRLKFTKIEQPASSRFRLQTPTRWPITCPIYRGRFQENPLPWIAASSFWIHQRETKCNCERQSLQFSHR